LYSTALQSGQLAHTPSGIDFLFAPLIRMLEGSSFLNQFISIDISVALSSAPRAEPDSVQSPTSDVGYAARAWSIAARN
jgi:hypothetical protein